MEYKETMSVRKDADRMIPSLFLFGYEVDPLSFIFSFASSTSSEESSLLLPPLLLPPPMRKLMMATIIIPTDSARIRKSPILDIDAAGGRASMAAAPAGTPERVKGSAVAVVIPLQGGCRLKVYENSKILRGLSLYPNKISTTRFVFLDLPAL